MQPISALALDDINLPQRDISDICVTDIFDVAYNVYNRHLLLAFLIHHIYIYLFSNRLNSSMDLSVETLCDNKTDSQVVLGTLVAAGLVRI